MNNRFFLTTLIITVVTTMAVAAEKSKTDAPLRPDEVEGRRDNGNRRGANNIASERRLQRLERAVELLEDRVEDLELGGGGGGASGYYCIAQCVGATYTQTGGSGRTQSEAKVAAVNELLKKWTCHTEITECSEERRVR